MEKHNNPYGSTPEEQTSCFFTNSNNWDFNPMDQNDPFESALSSMVSSPVASSGGGGGGGENVMLRELIGRLGSICNSGEISPHCGGNNTSANTTCYSTPLNSPPKLNLSVMDYQIRGNSPFSGSHLAPFPSDPGFVDRAARFSCFAKNDTDFSHKSIPKLDSCKISGASTSNNNWSNNVSGSQTSLKPDGLSARKFSRSNTPENSGIGDSMEISSLTEQITVGENTVNPLNEANPRKRKSIAKGKAKDPTKDANVVASEKTDTADAKRSKSEEDNVQQVKDGTKVKTESNGNSKSTGGDGNNKKQIKEDKLPEPPKDYIHVRARRGQATDAHSLAERVRREKISERMKLLQNLVPGCNMVTGKAVMLDEIINYVQSLQHQVEFLSMKLATINPRSDLNIEAHMSKDVISHQGLLHHNIYQSNAGTPEFSHPFYPPQGPSGMQSGMPNGMEAIFAMNHLNGSTGQNTSMQMPSSDNFAELASQVPTFWGNDLHSVVQMGVNQNQSQTFSDIMTTAQMKIEQ